MATRAERLLQLLQYLREQRMPVVAEQLARQLQVSVRTTYRDIDALRAQGAMIEGSPGVGYSLRPGFMLPPLNFTDGELQALVLGLRWVLKNTDTALQQSAHQVLSKVYAVVPESDRQQLDTMALTVGRQQATNTHVYEVRQAIQQGRKIKLDYRDAQGELSQRIVWPCVMAFFEETRLIAAWCELRQEFRHFRLDRIQALEILDSYTTLPYALLKAWQQDQGISV